MPQKKKTPAKAPTSAEYEMVEIEYNGQRVMAKRYKYRNPDEDEGAFPPSHIPTGHIRAKLGYNDESR